MARSASVWRGQQRRWSRLRPRYKRSSKTWWALTHTRAHSWSEKHVWAMHTNNLISLCFKPKCQTHLMAAAVQTWGFAAFLCLCPCILNIFVFSAVAQKKKQSLWRCNLGPFFNDFLTFYTLNCGANYKGNSLQINQWALTAGLHRVFITVTGWMFISCVESDHAAVKRSVKVKSLGENRSRFQDKFSHKPKICPFCLQLVRMDYTEVIIDQRFHRHLIGKNGANSECT